MSGPILGTLSNNRSSGDIYSICYEDHHFCETNPMTVFSASFRNLTICNCLLLLSDARKFASKSSHQHQGIQLFISSRILFFILVITQHSPWLPGFFFIIIDMKEFVCPCPLVLWHLIASVPPLQLRILSSGETNAFKQRSFGRVHCASIHLVVYRRNFRMERWYSRGDRSVWECQTLVHWNFRRMQGSRWREGVNIVFSRAGESRFIHSTKYFESR
jgi:hypothetical protein